jgi:glycerophosphoryl diester phosphodiesterase
VVVALAACAVAGGIGILGAAAPPAGGPPAVFGDAPRPLVIAHRGGGGEAPESTLAAYRAAVALDPLAGVEVDLRRSRDGHLVVMHDATVDRTTDGTGRVADLSLAELRALDAGYCATPGRGNGTAPRGRCRGPAASADPSLFPFRGRGHRVPTLGEVLEILPPETPVVVEVKAPGLEDQVARELRASGRLRRVIVGSADGDVAARLQALLPEAAHFFPRAAALRLVLAAKLTDARLAWPAYQVLAAPVAGLGLRLDTPGLLRALERRGIPVAYFTINDEPDLERLFRLGASAVFTDYPSRARRIRHRLTAHPAHPAHPDQW